MMRFGLKSLVSPLAFYRAMSKAKGRRDTSIPKPLQRGFTPPPKGFVDLRQTWHYTWKETSRLGHVFTHAKAGWPFARTLKARLKANSKDSRYVSKQQMQINAGDKRGMCALRAAHRCLLAPTAPSPQPGCIMQGGHQTLEASRLEKEWIQVFT